jgi:hypothetical protein
MWGCHYADKVLLLLQVQCPTGSMQHAVMAGANAVQLIRTVDSLPAMALCCMSWLVHQIMPSSCNLSSRWNSHVLEAGSCAGAAATKHASSVTARQHVRSLC